jgi:hypothetical protein
MTAPSGFRGLPPEGTNPRAVAAVVNRMLQGGLNCAGTITLTPSAGSTLVSDPRASGTSRIVLFPTTSNAAAELGNGSVYISGKAKGSFTLAHANNAQSDRTFDYVILG